VIDFAAPQSCARFFEFFFREDRKSAGSSTGER